MIFAKNTTFTSTSPSQLEAHLTSLHSIDPSDFDSSAHQIDQEEDEGSRYISSKGTLFILPAAALKILELGAGASIVEVACRILPILNNIVSTNFEAVTDWIQASFTTRGDGFYISGPILT